MRLEVFLLSASLALLISPLRPARADIVGGVEVRPKDPIRSSTAALYSPSRSGQGGGLCTASLIGSDMAVTAAHCIQPGGPRPVLIFGRNLKSPDAAKRPVTGVAVNPGWRTRQGRGMDQGDIALVRFPGGLPDGYESTSLPDTEAILKKGKTAILAGYGISNAQTHSGAGVLRKTSVKIADPRTGKPEMVLDQSRGHGACHGDSGGPAYVRSGGRTVLVGVTNRSHPSSAPDDCAHQVVYTKVAAYRPWIQKSEERLRSSREGTSFFSQAGAKAAKRSSHTRKMKHGRSAAQRAHRRMRTARVGSHAKGPRAARGAGHGQAVSVPE
jgi:hypothetical protein